MLQAQNQNIQQFPVTDIKVLLSTIFVVFFLFPQLRGQPHDFDLTPNQLKKAGKHAEREKDYFSAIDFYEKYLVKKPSDYKISFSLAEMYRFTRDYNKARNEYAGAYEIQNEKNVLALYYLGRMEMALGNYEQALISFRDFRKKYRYDKNEFNYRKYAKIWMEGCELAMADSVFKENIYLSHIDSRVNMAYNEFSPLPLGSDKLIFASLRSDTIIHYEDSTYQDTSIHKTSFHSGDLKNGKWEYSGKVIGPFEFNDANVGSICFNLDTSAIYYTICRKNWKFEMICNIYTAKRNGNSWSEPELLSENINSKKFSSTQPAIGLNPKNGNEILFFASNNPEGRGGFDLWYSEKKKGEFAVAKNLGGRINTESDEMTPFFDWESSSLYFSSNGHPSYGEMDIFKSFGNKSKWMKNPQNLGKPFNSSADDLYYIHGENPQYGFMTSNREGGRGLKNPTCCDDIYFFEYDEFRRYTYRSAVISDDPDSKIISGDVEVYLRDAETGDTTYLKRVEINKNGILNVNVERDLNYLLIIESPDHFIQAVEIPPKNQEFNFEVTDTIRVVKLSDKAFILENIYYDFDDWRLTNEAEKAIDTTLLKILKLNPEIKVEISSHTDSKGSGTYNITLSQKRAESVVQYLKRNGISSSRMVAKGYGKTQPIAPNTNEDGSDNPVGRQLNRRTEFKVIGFTEKVKYRELPTNKYAR